MHSTACSNAHVERLIGSIRRECLYHLMVSGEGHLRRILKTYATYIATLILGGLHHRYARV
jgi:hypothetical protein